jgi:FG-GAP-like repeat
MKRLIQLLSAGLCAFTLWSVSRPAEVPFTKIMIDGGAAETVAFADINKDGKLDIVSGEYWYQAPSWTPHRFRELKFQGGYIGNFCDLALDINKDGYPDIVSCLGFAHRLVWMENPGAKGGAWKEHLIDQGSFIEFAFLVDLDNDKKAEELLPDYLGDSAPTVWFEIKNGEFVKHVVSAKSYGHGIGVGDINGDGRNDIITHKGWFEAPPDPRTGDWVWHPDFDLGETGFIYAVDVNGDGRNDLVASAAHDYGIFWWEQGPNSHWTKHVIDDTWSQGHGLTMVDVNRDGKPDFLTGKRYMAHDHDPGSREPLGIYWYEFLMDEGTVRWVKHVIDYSSRTGAGLHIPTADLYGDGGMEFAAAGKNGLFLFENRPSARKAGSR